MTRRVTALCLSGWLAACSGEHTQSTKSLGSGTGADAGGDSGSERVDAGNGASEDGGDQGADAALDGADAEVTIDGGTGTDAGDATTPDASNTDPNSFSLRVLYLGNPLSGAPVVYSQSDGTVDKYVETNAQGLVTSTYAPGMVTVVLPGDQISQLNYRSEMLTVVAPALGDHLTVDVPPSQRLAENVNIPYRMSLSALPEGAYGASAYAGVDACAVGRMQVHQLSNPYNLRRGPNCQLESNGYLIADATGENGELLGFAGATLPAPGGDGAPVVSLGSWTAPVPFSLTISNTAISTRTNAEMWLRKGQLRAPARADTQTAARIFPFLMPNGLVDTFDATVFVSDDDLVEHSFQKNCPASNTGLTVDYATALPSITSLSDDFTTQLRPVATWTVASPMPADAAFVSFTWDWTEGDAIGALTWRLLVPPDRLTVTAPILPSEGKLALPLLPPDTTIRPQVDEVKYFDSDQQNGYRDFLKEPLRYPAEKAYLGAGIGFPLERETPVGGTVRTVRRFPFVDVGT